MPIYMGPNNWPIEGYGRGSGYRYIKPTGQTGYQMYVDNERFGGGWVLLAVVRTAQNTAHISSSAVNFNNETVDGITVGVKAFDSATSKMSDAWINAFMGDMKYDGTTPIWLEALDFNTAGYDAVNMFVSKPSSMDLVNSADGDNARTICSTTYEGTLSDRGPNGGTRGLGDHHTGLPYFAWGRHPEQGTNPGFRQDTMGQSDGYLWMKS